jgi:hypothetical protein
MEVLIATAILAVGLLAIMALFPLGAVNIARAINQDRSSTHGVNSDTVFRYYWKSAWLERNPPYVNQTQYGLNYAPLYGLPTGAVCATNEDAYRNSQEPMLLLLDAHPSYGRAIGSQESFPVLVDPIGWQTKSGDPIQQGYIAGNRKLPLRTTLRRAIRLPYLPFDQPGATPPAQFARVAPFAADPTGTWNYPFYAAPAATYNPRGYSQPYPTDTQAAIRLTTLLDDMTFAKDGDGSTSAVFGEPADFTGQLERGGRYSVAWLIQRADNGGVPSDVNVKVLVYAGRSITDTPSAETDFPLAQIAQQGSKLISVNLNGQGLPNVRVGGWVALSQISSIPLSTRYPTFDFYRITGINNTDPNVLNLEIEIPVQRTAWPEQYAVFFDNLVEVFDRGIVGPSRIIAR